MSCYRTLEASGPQELAQILDLWALRKEKVLEVLDVRAAKKARRLARTCRTLMMTQPTSLLDPQWQGAWQSACREAFVLLANVPVSRSEPTSDEVPISQRTTVKAKRVSFTSGAPMKLGSPEAIAGRQSVPPRLTTTLPPPPKPSVKYHGLRGA